MTQHTLLSKIRDAITQYASAIDSYKLTGDEKVLRPIVDEILQQGKGFLKADFVLKNLIKIIKGTKNDAQKT